MTLKRAAAVGLTMTVLALGAACSPDGESATSGADRLVYATNAPIETINYSREGGVVAMQAFNGNVLEGLSGIARQSNGELAWPWLLAESAEQTKPTEWTIKLNENISFQNGEKLTAADAVFSINNAVGPGSTPDTVTENLLLATVVDESTLTLTTKVPDSAVERALYRIGVVPDGTDFDAGFDALVGTGPYRLTSLSNQGNEATFERWDDYRGEKPSIREIKMVTMPEDGARLASLQTGEVTVAFDLKPALLAKTPNVITVPGGSVEALRIETRRAPFDSVSARQAISQAIDRAAIAEQTRSGFATIASDQIIPPDALGYNTSMDEYGYDPEAARQLINEAGLTGETVSLICSPEIFGQIAGDVCATLAQQLKDVGLDATTDFASYDNWLKAMAAGPEGSPDLILTEVGTDNLRPDIPMFNYIECDGKFNAYCNPEFDSEIDRVKTLNDAEQLEQDWASLMSTLREDAPFIAIDVPSLVAAAQDGVTGVMYPFPQDIHWAEWSLS